MATQLIMELAEKVGWGGRRKGAGRNPKGARAMVSRAARPFHDGAHPVLVTERFVRQLPSMRDLGLGQAIAAMIRAARSRTFQVIH